MAKRAHSRQFFDLAAGLAILISMIGLVAFPTQGAEAARQSIDLCLSTVIPSLFPFFVLSTLMVELGLARYLGRALEGVMRPLFGLGGNCASAVVLGFVGGYPIGAKTAVSLYEKGLCSRDEAERLLSFCNNSGPAFILGAVGAGIFSSAGAGILLYLSHILGSLLVGFIFRFYRKGPRFGAKRDDAPSPSTRLTTAFTDSVRSSAVSMMSVCAFVVFFGVAIRMLTLFGVIPTLSEGLGHILGPLGLDADKLQHLITGFIEVTSGLGRLQGATGPMAQHLAMAAFMLGWGGISIHCQVLSFVGGSGLSLWLYFIGKGLHGLFSAAIAYVMVSMGAFSLPALAPPASSFPSGQNGFTPALGYALAGCLLVALAVLFTPGGRALKKHWKKG